jgi:hypothetical protein
MVPSETGIAISTYFGWLPCSLFKKPRENRARKVLIPCKRVKSPFLQEITIDGTGAPFPFIYGNPFCFFNTVIWILTLFRVRVVVISTARTVHQVNLNDNHPLLA